MRLYVVRHGQTDYNKAGRIQGQIDIHLNSEGIKQAEEVSKKFAKRLNTYLKKYGLEKLNVWTYCRD